MENSGCVNWREMPLEMVLWYDIAGGSGWRPKEEYDQSAPILCRSVGFLAKEEKDYIVLMQTENFDMFDGSLAIPKAVIAQRHRIAQPNAVKRLMEK